MVGVGVTVKMVTEQCVQPGHPSHPVGQPSLGQAASRLVLNLDVMVILSPIVTNEQHNGPPVSQY
jgi:hypothetical protein